MTRTFALPVLLGLLIGTGSVARAASSNLLDPDAVLKSSLPAGTHIVMLGTGTPVPDASRAGASVAIVHNGQAYLFDVGAGSIQRAIEADSRLGIDELDPLRIGHVFLTHLHNDHTLDYAEWAGTLWWRRSNPLKSWGPEGLAAMTDGMYAMMGEDVRIRTSGSQPVLSPDAYRVGVTEIRPGKVFADNGIEVHAFPVPHGEVKPAYGYKIITSDRSIVISGDTAFSEELIRQSAGVDVLVHEVISDVGMRKLSEFWQNYHSSSHTTTRRLAEVARRARPKLLVLNHVLFYGETPDAVLSEIKTEYDGKVVLASDLDVF